MSNLPICTQTIDIGRGCQIATACGVMKKKHCYESNLAWTRHWVPQLSMFVHMVLTSINHLFTTPVIVVVAAQPRCWVVSFISANGCDPSFGRNNCLSMTTCFYHSRPNSVNAWAIKSSRWFSCPVAIMKSFGSSRISSLSTAWTYSGAHPQSRSVERLPTWSLSSSPFAIAHAPIIIFRDTKRDDRRGLSWLKRTPLQA